MVRLVAIFHGLCMNYICDGVKLRDIMALAKRSENIQAMFSGMLLLVLSFLFFFFFFV